MNGKTLIDFQDITKYPLVDFLKEYQEFLLNNYSAIYAYFAGKTVELENQNLVVLKHLSEEIKNLQAQFKNFGNRLNNCEYWELMDYIDDLNNTLEKIKKLPKFLRTSLSKRGYTPSVQVNMEVGGLKTIDDVANVMTGSNTDSTSWIDLMLNNDLSETDWEIDELRNITIYVNNLNKIIVTTIIDMPIGSRVYGKDLTAKIGFANNDLSIVEAEENIEQKCKILLELQQGDVPENVLLGLNPELTTTNVKGYSYSEVFSQLRNTFMQNDLFESVEVTGLAFDSSQVNAEVNIKTKYDYQTTKQITI